MVYITGCILENDSSYCYRCCFVLVYFPFFLILYFRQRTNSILVRTSTQSGDYFRECHRCAISLLPLLHFTHVRIIFDIFEWVLSSLYPSKQCVPTKWFDQWNSKKQPWPLPSYRNDSKAAESNLFLSYRIKTDR